MIEMTTDAFRTRCDEAGIHTVEVAIGDTYGHLRGKRVPVDRYFAEVAESGASLADAVFILNVCDELIDHEIVNMDNGFLDTRIVPDPAAARLLTHRPGYALVCRDSFGEHGAPHVRAPRAGRRRRRGRQRCYPRAARGRGPRARPGPFSCAATPAPWRAQGGPPF